MQLSPTRSLSADYREMGYIPAGCIASPTSRACLPEDICSRAIHWLILHLVNPRAIARTLLPCALVCRSWSELTRLCVEHAEDSWVHLALQGQTTISNEDRLYLSLLPNARALALEALTHISLYPLLLKYPRPKSFRSITYLWLRNRVYGHPLSIPSLGGLCGTIAASDTLRNLWLDEVVWENSANDLVPVAPSRSCAWLNELAINADRRWLLDSRSVEFLSWLAQSGAVVNLPTLYLRGMMILEERLLGALLAVLDASRQTLVKLVCCFGPELSLLPLITTLSQCTQLEQLYIDIPCSHSAFLQLLKFASDQSLSIKQLQDFSITLLRHPMCTEPDSTMWGRLDEIFQTPPYLAIEDIIASHTDLDTASRTVSWGDLYPFAYRDPVEGRREIARLLPLTYQRRGLWHWDNPDGDASRIPARVDCAFPVEICERVMDFVAGERRYLFQAWALGVHSTLVSCSLTCRAWRPRAQTHLFRAVSMGSEEAELSKLRILLSNNPALGPFVKACTLYKDKSPPALSLHMLPIGVTRLLPNLKHLRIVQGTLHVPPCASFGPSIRRLSSLTKLSIIEAVLPSVEEVRQVICACRHLRELSLERCAWQNTSLDTPGPDTAPFPSPICRSRTSIRLHTIDVSFQMEWASDKRTCQILRWLALSGALDFCADIYLSDTLLCNHDILAAVEAVVCAASKAMVKLGLTIGVGVELTQLSAALSACHKLEFLFIYLPYDTATFAQLADLLHGAFVDTNVHRNLDLVIYPICCPSLLTEPSAGQWQALDDIFQAAAKRMFGTVRVTRWFLNAPVGLDSKPESVDWNSVELREDVEFDTRLKTLLPQTFERNVLYIDFRIRAE